MINNLLLALRTLAVHIHNLILFTVLAIWNGIPPWLWRKAWLDIEAEHLAQVRKRIWELKVEGKVYEDREGRLWWKGE